MAIDLEDRSKRRSFAKGHEIDNAQTLHLIENNIGADRNWFKCWIDNLEANLKNLLKYNIQNTKSLFGKAWCEDVIVIGAGSSFMKNESNQNRLKKMHQLGIPIIAVDRAFKKLQEINIMPEIVISIDAQDKVKDFFEFRNGKLLPIAVISLSSSPKVFDQLAKHTKMIYGYLSANPFCSTLLFAYNEYGSEYACLRAGGVVYVSAIELAMQMGFKYIISLGNDMIYYTPTDVLKDKDTETPKPIPVENSDRFFVYTIPAFLSARKHLEIYTDKTDIKFFNCSHVEGMTIKGWDRCSFDRIHLTVFDGFNEAFYRLTGSKKLKRE